MPLTPLESANNLQIIGTCPDRPWRFSTAHRPVLTPFKRYRPALVAGINTLQGSTTGCTGHRPVQRICRVNCESSQSSMHLKVRLKICSGGGSIMHFRSLSAPGATSARLVPPPLAHILDAQRAPLQVSTSTVDCPRRVASSLPGGLKWPASANRFPLRSALSPNVVAAQRCAFLFGGRVFG